MSRSFGLMVKMGRITKFSAFVVGGDRTIIQAVSTSFKGSPDAGSFDALIRVWSRESPAMMMSNLPLPLDAMNLLANVHIRAELEQLEVKFKKLQDKASLNS